MFSVIFVIHLLICVGIIGLVLLQQGKGAEAGAVFGGSGDSVIGAGSAPNFIGRLTTGLAIAFMLTSILLIKSYMSQTVTPTSTAKDVLEGSVLNVQVPEGEDTTPEATKQKEAMDVETTAKEAPAVANDEPAKVIPPQIEENTVETQTAVVGEDKKE